MFALEQITITRAPMRAPGANAPEHGWRPRSGGPGSCPPLEREVLLLFGSVVVSHGRFDQFEECTRPPAFAEPITTMITDALPRATEGFTTGAPSSRAGSQ